MLKKQNRLTKKKDFDRLFRSAEAKYYGKLLGVRIVANGLDYNRFGFVVSRRYCHLAVERNLIRRRLATIVEENLSKMEQGPVITSGNKGSDESINYEAWKQ